MPRLQLQTIVSIAIVFAAITVSSTPIQAGAGWGGSASATPGSDATGRAARSSLFDPMTWVPVVAAACLQIGGADQQIADWAFENRPVFGSQAAAGRRSDQLRGATMASYWVTGLLAPGGGETTSWVRAKAQGFAVGFAAVSTNYGVTATVKSASGRDRPDGSNDRSFPSGHTSTASVHATLAMRTVDYFSIHRTGKLALQYGIYGLALGTAWARVEAYKHYPADVLVGLGLGNFIAGFFNDAFLDPNGERDLDLQMSLTRRDGTMKLTYRF